MGLRANNTKITIIIEYFALFKKHGQLCDILHLIMYAFHFDTSKISLTSWSDVYNGLASGTAI